MITSSVRVPDDLSSLVDAYRTCELLTVNRRGIPIAWPTVSLYRPDDGTFLITTSIALPQKAFNVRANPDVALLFSDPTASGLDSPPHVLVQGTASCPDEVVTSVGPRAALWARLSERQPASRTHGANPVSRYLMDFYYMRLLITVTPTAVRSRPGIDRSPVRVAEAPAGDQAADDAYAAVVRRLPQFSPPVLSGFDAAGRPTLIRVRPTPLPSSRSFAISVPDGETMRPGAASLLCHSHDEQLWNLRSFVAVGDLQQDGERWIFTPARFLPGGAPMGPLGMVRIIRDLRATAAKYLRVRDLTRPAIPWDEYKRATAHVAGRR
jgi:hypothetical protein